MSKEQINLSDALNEINSIKTQLGTSMDNKGMTVTNEFESYPTAVDNYKKLAFPFGMTMVYDMPTGAEWLFNGSVQGSYDINTAPTGIIDLATLGGFRPSDVTDFVIIKSNSGNNNIVNYDFNSACADVEAQVNNDGQLVLAINTTPGELGYALFTLCYDYVENEGYQGMLHFTVIVEDLFSVPFEYRLALNGYRFDNTDAQYVSAGQSYTLNVLGLPFSNQNDDVPQTFGNDINHPYFAWMDFTDLGTMSAIYSDLDSMEVVSNDESVLTVSGDTDNGFTLNVVGSGETTISLKWYASDQYYEDQGLTPRESPIYEWESAPIYTR